jgi:hypothetical protein
MLKNNCNVEYKMNEAMVVNFKHRYQRGLTIPDVYPNITGFCACGCGIELKGCQKKWATKNCSYSAYINVAIVKGNTKVIRDILYSKEEGFCRSCGVFDENWQADHIKPVFKGGGACEINNFQTLCPYCHIEKTKNQMESHTSSVL